MKKSICVNVIVNIINTILKFIFPLITFPYVSRVLGVEPIGKVNYANSIVSYFLLLAGLGISSYAIREGTIKRQDRNKFSDFASQMFSINMLSTIFSYLLLFILLFFEKELYAYKTLLLLLSSQIVCITLGMDWINTCYEEFVYIAVRTIIIQVISIGLIFVLIKDAEDYYWYAVIIAFSNVGANILNYIHIKKFVVIKFTISTAMIKHIKPIIYIFFACLASAIYTSLDTTMLGAIKGDYAVGIYSAAFKVYQIFKQGIFALIIVFEPRLFSLAKTNESEYKKLLKILFSILLIILIPISVGVSNISNDIILLLAGTEFVEAKNVLNILIFSLIFCTLGYSVMHCILLPFNLEKYLGIATSLGAISNALLNFLLIPHYGAKGAAIATLLTEFIVMLFSTLFIRNRITCFIEIKTVICCLVGNLMIVLVIKFIALFNMLISIKIIVEIAISAFLYFTIFILSKEVTINIVLSTLRNKIKNIWR